MFEFHCEDYEVLFAPVSDEIAQNDPTCQWLYIFANNAGLYLVQRIVPIGWHEVVKDTLPADWRVTVIRLEKEASVVKMQGLIAAFGERSGVRCCHLNGDAFETVTPLERPLGISMDRWLLSEMGAS
jgi:hypothetical protein